MFKPLEVFFMTPISSTNPVIFVWSITTASQRHCKSCLNRNHITKNRLFSGLVNKNAELQQLSYSFGAHLIRDGDFWWSLGVGAVSWDWGNGMEKKLRIGSFMIIPNKCLSTDHMITVKLFAFFYFIVFCLKKETQFHHIPIKDY